MLTDLSQIIKQRLEAFEKNPQEALKLKGKEYNKDYAFAVKCFQERINKDRKKEKKEPLPFMAIKNRLVGIKEVDDLRWFYKQCLQYSYQKNKITGKRNVFSRCFFGATKV